MRREISNVIRKTQRQKREHSLFVNVFNIENKALILQTDGGAKGNPGIGGYGGVIYANK